MTALLGTSQQDSRRLGESLWMSSTTFSSRFWAEQEQRASGRMKAFAGSALAAPARVPGVMGTLPWDPSRLSPSTGRLGPGEMEEDKLCQHRPRPWAAATMDKDMGSVASVVQHELISFLDDTDTDADEFILCSSNNPSPSSVPLAHFLIDEDEIDRDPSSTRATRSTSTNTDIISNTRPICHNQQQQQQSQQHHKQSPSSSSYHNLYLRPDSSRSHQHFHFPRTSSESGSRSGTGPTPTATANSTTWTLRSGKSHEKSNSSGSKKTTATTVSAANSATMAVKPTKVNTTGSATITVPPPPVSPSSSGPFGAQMTKQEFEALPEAIQRKYFSSLERLHFASLAPAPTPPSTHIDIYFDRPDTAPTPKTLKQRRKERQARLASDQVSDRVKRRPSRRANFRASTSSSVYVRLPDKIRKRHLTTEEQIVASRNRRHDIILDPADEAIYKVRRRASSLIVQDELWSPTLSVRPSTMESRRPSQDTRKQMPKSEEKKSPEAQKKRDSFYDSFRWLEEDDDLDLRLHLDDYHANLREDLPANSKQRRPSFRRHLSISKIPFGRNSLSTNRPGTTPAGASHPTTPLFSSSPVSPQTSSPGHGRRRSRALSLISPKHSPQDTVAAFDPEAAHYQDPEARLKLRVYLASPQKFDEAIEFGFPSKEAMVTTKPSKDVKPLKYRQSRAALVDESENLRTFLADDRSSIFSDDGSLDSDSPKTPHTVEMTALRPPPIKNDQLHSPKPSTEYARMPAEAREMTLRMTLTRPDLRAHEDQMYGWQQKPLPPRKFQSNGLQDEFPTSTYVRDASSKESIERHFAAMDQENAQANDRGVMKRFWNKVRRGPA
ncbi:mucin [Colletotrichum scovillei]|nr:mucin [Colletotrichum scovillei]